MYIGMVFAHKTECWLEGIHYWLSSKGSQSETWRGKDIMKKVSLVHIGSTIILTILFAAFTMMNIGCSNEPVLTEPLDEDLAPDAESTMDIESSVDIISEAIEVKVGERFAISLQSNPTTGYRWHPEFDSEFLKLVESEFVPPSSEMIGAAGVETFVFSTLKQGQVEVTMIYKRPWEDEAFDEQSKKVNIVPADIQAPALDQKVGEKFTISLKSNPTTGYTWHPEFDSEFLELVGREFVSDSTVPGSPGIEAFEFLALKQGEVKVKMTYKRSWEEQILDECVTLVKIESTS